MNVLHLSAVKNWGGGEHHIENLYKELLDTNPEINNIILCAKDAAFHNRLKTTKINFETGIRKLKIDLRYVLKINTICKTQNIELIHIHDPIALQLAIISDKIFKLPPFVFSKKTSFKIKQRKKTLYKYNYLKIKKILCVSKETQRVCEKAITDHKKLITIYHGTNLKTKSTQTPFNLREKFNITPDKKIIGNIANHIRAKHLDTWIDIANRIVNDEKRDDFIFIQIGEYTNRTDALLQRVKTLKLENHMMFLGYTTNASNFISQFDISVMTSQSEGIPQFIYESMYHKTPIVSTNVGGIPEIIDHNSNGLLANTYDDETLTKQVFALSNQPELQQQFIEKAHKKLIANFTTSKMAQETLKVYETVIKACKKK